MANGAINLFSGCYKGTYSNLAEQYPHEMASNGMVAFSWSS